MEQRKEVVNVVAGKNIGEKIHHPHGLQFAVLMIATIGLKSEPMLLILPVEENGLFPCAKLVIINQMNFH